MLQYVSRARLGRGVLLAIPLLLLTLVLRAAPVQASTLPGGFSETVVAGGLDSPTAFAFAADGRIFVTQQGGALRVIKNNALLPVPFITLDVNSTGERGLLGIALDPKFNTNPARKFVYVYYTVNVSPPHNRLSRFTAVGDVAAPGSETILVELEDLSATNHNGGAIHFGPDNKLYVAVGENAVAANAQTLNNRLGKILRYNADGSIPVTNPFYTTATGINRSIWALGLRNPFTFAFQPGTGRIFINDVGGSTREEINDGIAGSNYGWKTCEGFCNPPNPNFRDPLYIYPHADPGNPHYGCAIIGAAFYNPTTVQFPADYVGDYFFADLCRGWIDRYDPNSNTVDSFVTGAGAAVDLYVSPGGALYFLSRSSNEVRRITYSAPAQTATFTPTRTNTPPNTATRTNTPPNTATRTNTPVNTPTRTATRTRTPTRTATLVPSATPLPSQTPLPTNTRTPTRTRTSTRVPTATFTPDGAWVYCAKEGKKCIFSGTRQVRFGAGTRYKIKTFTDMVPCNIANFGDPAPGVKKHCDYQ